MPTDRRRLLLLGVLAAGGACAEGPHDPERPSPEPFAATVDRVKRFAASIPECLPSAKPLPIEEVMKRDWTWGDCLLARGRLVAIPFHRNCGFTPEPQGFEEYAVPLDCPDGIAWWLWGSQPIPAALTFDQPALALPLGMLRPADPAEFAYCNRNEADDQAMPVLGNVALPALAGGESRAAVDAALSNLEVTILGGLRDIPDRRNWPVSPQGLPGQLEIIGICR
jgi:hypothetical protein